MALRANMMLIFLKFSKIGLSWYPPSPWAFRSIFTHDAHTGDRSHSQFEFADSKQLCVTMLWDLSPVCALWVNILLNAQGGEGYYEKCILEKIRKISIMLARSAQENSIFSCFLDKKIPFFMYFKRHPQKEQTQTKIISKERQQICRQLEILTLLSFELQKWPCSQNWWEFNQESISVSQKSLSCLRTMFASSRVCVTMTTSW